MLVDKVLKLTAGGGSATVSTARDGGTGTDGIIIVTEYF